MVALPPTWEQTDAVAQRSSMVKAVFVAVRYGTPNRRRKA